jgi:HEPN domain-containing protein
MTVVDEWIAKAKADYQGAVTLNRRRSEPLPDLVCYHCQQSAEKYLKAYLIKNGIIPPTIHDLSGMLRLCQRYDPTLAPLDADAGILNPYGVLIRYPGLSATADDAVAAVNAIRRMRRVVRRLLGL